jgi:hypothetical protein
VLHTRCNTGVFGTHDSTRQLSLEFQSAVDAFSNPATYPGGDAGATGVAGVGREMLFQGKREMLFQGVRKLRTATTKGGGGGGKVGGEGGPSDDELKAIWDSYALGQGQGPGKEREKGRKRGSAQNGDDGGSSVFRFLADVVLEIPREEYNGQAQALIANALSKTLLPQHAAPALGHLAASIVGTDVQVLKGWDGVVVG